MRDLLITPITRTLIASEALAQERHGLLNEQQKEDIHSIHLAAVNAFRRTVIALDHFESKDLNAIYDIAHDLLSPSATLISFSDLLLKGISGDLNEGQIATLEGIHWSAKHNRLQLSNIIDYARIHTQKPLEQSDYDFQRIMPRYGDLAVGECQVDIHWWMNPTPPVHTSPICLQRSVENIVANAVRFTQKGRITLGTLATDDVVEIRVSDTGRGIQHEHLACIFDPFWQAEQDHRGIGLGLFIAKHMVEMQGGTIHIESEPQVGTTVTMTIPLAPSQDGQPAIPSTMISQPL